ncbi:lysine exporter LysO family protein [Volucribacter amazonae]|uniref:Lysine exporter LysO family protein n=1 Tax=Volucribacter amazonae TaxID=256731 RepID=A0A9X4PLT7_9PAST|nr:lysine exporter LysO family protein [Volucribacter amazonae]MDG6894143.1 hypothetical protein [Volucribacter amazonae]
MFEGLMIILAPMFLGYCVKVKARKVLAKINQLLMLLLYIILFVMGYHLGQLDNIMQKLPQIASSALIFALLINGCNLFGLIFYDKLNTQTSFHHSQQQITSRWGLLWDSFKLCGTVIIGFIIGLFVQNNVILPADSSTYLLVMLIFLVGIQLRNNGISLMQVFFNKQGIYTALIMILTSLLGGAMAALWLDLPITQGLAMASGLGWYTLSSVIIHDAWGAVFGSIAFLNDLLKEILSLFLIPLLMKGFRAAAIGVAGATALDVNLPIIQRAGGIGVVPLAISFGFITNIIAPILLVVFSAIPLN